MYGPVAQPITFVVAAGILGTLTAKQDLTGEACTAVLAEILAGAAILYRPTRLIGAVAAIGLMIGAIGFHLSPWLGTSIPTGLADDAASPWDAADFATTTSSGTFVLAIISAIRAASIVRTELKSRQSATAAAESTGRREAVVQL